MNGTILCALLLGIGQTDPGPSSQSSSQPDPVSYLAQPAYCLKDVIHLPLREYVPQPGDLFLSTDQALWSRFGHALAGGPGLHHSGTIFALPDGGLGLLEAGPYNTPTIQVLDPWKHMNDHVMMGDQVYVRRRKVPLTPEQSARLTAWACAQNGKPFATCRMLRQITPFRTRGPIRTHFMGFPNGERDRFFCSELVCETCVFAGLMDPVTTRPSATYPADLFFGCSINPYLDQHLWKLEVSWDPPARWFPTPPQVAP